MSKDEARVGSGVYAKVAVVRSSDGSLLRRASFGAATGSTRVRGASYIAGICASLRQGTEERRPGRKAIAEAATRPTMRFVEIKSEMQLEMQTLHRARERLVAERTALINQVRSVLLEREITVAQGRRKLENQLPGILADESLGLSIRIRRLIGDLREEWQRLNERIAAFDAEFVSRARTDEAARQLTTIPGIGSINATALMAAVGNGRAFARGRDMAAWLGLVPRQRTTGGKPRLLGISKRGDRYLRKNLIHEGRAVLP